MNAAVNKSSRLKQVVASRCDTVPLYAEAERAAAQRLGERPC